MSLWTRFKLLFVKGHWVTDNTLTPYVRVFIKYLDGVVYIIREEFRT
jgi:stringent starvation protein B